MLSTLLENADLDSQTGKLHTQGGRAFVSMSLRPYLISALLNRDPNRPAIVVAGDDRQARALAARRPPPPPPPPPRAAPPPPPARLGIWPAACAPGSRRAKSATTRAGASPTSRIWLRQRTSPASG
jgi:hypothetical protein